MSRDCAYFREERHTGWQPLEAVLDVSVVAVVDFDVAAAAVIAVFVWIAAGKVVVAAADGRRDSSANLAQSGRNPVPQEPAESCVQPPFLPAMFLPCSLGWAVGAGVAVLVAVRGDFSGAGKNSAFPVAAAAAVATRGPNGPRTHAPDVP